MLQDVSILLIVAFYFFFFSESGGCAMSEVVKAMGNDLTE